MEVALFQAARPHLLGIAYRMLGSNSLAEDVLQDAWLRVASRPAAQIGNVEAFLTTVVTRLCIDQLRLARQDREKYVGVWLPEPLPPATALAVCEDTPEEDAGRFQSLSFAFLVVLEALTPLERAVFVLHEVFGYPHAEVSGIVGSSPDACRQSLRRARQALRGRVPERPATARHKGLLLAFIEACTRGNVDQLASLLAQDVVSHADGGGVAQAATRPVAGIRAVSRLYAGLFARAAASMRVVLASVNHCPSIVVLEQGRPVSVIQVRTRDNAVDAIFAQVNPRKLVALGMAFGGV